MTKYLVTGGAGFIGSNIVERLIELGHEVRVIDNLSTGKIENLNKVLNNIEFIKGDIRDIKVVKEAVSNIDYILHQAALPSVPRSIEDPIVSNDNNINGTLNLLSAAKDSGVKRFVYAASSSAYGDTPVLPKVETMPANPKSPYAINKYTGELYCKVFYDIYNMETICLRYFNVFGPKQNPDSQYAAVIPKFIRSILNDESPIIYGDGSQTRDFCYIKNVVQANILASQCEKTQGEVINIACNKRTSLNDLVIQINTLLEKNIKPEYTSLRPGDVRDSLADISLAKKIIGYEPQIYLQDGLKESINFYRTLYS